MELKRAVTLQTARRSRRLAMRWPARYMPPGDECWVDCSVVDLSIDGAALEIPLPAEEPQGRVAVELQSVDAQPIGLQLLAKVRHWNDTGDGLLRIGVEFEGTTNLERFMLANLVSRQRRASR